MKVLKIEPLKEPCIKDIDSRLETLCESVGGFIEAIYPFDNDDVAIVCNESGKINGLELNRALRNNEGKITDIIAGTFLIVGISEDDFCSLTDKQIDTYTEMFECPEMFVSVNGNIEAIAV